MSKLCPRCQYLEGAPLLSSTALILRDMDFTRAAILFHSSVMTSQELLDVRHMVLLHLPLEDAPHELNRVRVWRHTWPLHHLHLQQQGSCHLGGVFGVVMVEGRGSCSASECLSTCWNPCFPSMNRSSPVPAVVMLPQTMMLPPPCLTVGKAQFS